MTCKRCGRTIQTCTAVIGTDGIATSNDLVPLLWTNTPRGYTVDV